MRELADAILNLHKPSTLSSVQIPGIFQYAPACQECGKAHPCPTAKEVHHYQRKEALRDARNKH